MTPELEPPSPNYHTTPTGGSKNTNVAKHFGGLMDSFESETDKQILDIILDRKRYDYRVRPSNKTEVNVTVLILSLSSPDESSLKMNNQLHFPDLASGPINSLTLVSESGSYFSAK
ncbi:hypothetical protein TNCV_187581 [Trichonephila clavipes]|nr:hypothetical protein TNCV_187581 [Trichonephila clavipes]